MGHRQKSAGILKQDILKIADPQANPYEPAVHNFSFLYLIFHIPDSKY